MRKIDNGPIVLLSMLATLFFALYMAERDYNAQMEGQLNEMQAHAELHEKARHEWGVAIVNRFKHEDVATIYYQVAPETHKPTLLSVAKSKCEGTFKVDDFSCKLSGV